MKRVNFQILKSVKLSRSSRTKSWLFCERALHTTYNIGDMTQNMPVKNTMNPRKAPNIICKLADVMRRDSSPRSRYSLRLSQGYHD